MDQQGNAVHFDQSLGTVRPQTTSGAGSDEKRGHVHLSSVFRACARRLSG